MNQSAWIRPEWSAATITLMVFGFIVFWPLGLVMLAYILFGERLHAFTCGTEQSSDRSVGGSRRHGHRFEAGRKHDHDAFDDWRRKELERIEDERRRLDEMRAEFDAYLRELRRARDKDEFSEFMRDRKTGNGEDPAFGGR